MTNYWGREKSVVKRYMGWNKRLSIKSFPVWRKRVICCALALLMAFCAGSLLLIILRASLGAVQERLWDVVLFEDEARPLYR